MAPCARWRLERGAVLRWRSRQRGPRSRSARGDSSCSGRNLCRIEPGGQRIRDAFLRKPPPDAPWTVPILWDHSTQIQTKMNAEADVFGAPKPGRVDYAKHLRAKASRLLVVNRLRTDTVRVSACYAPQPLLGSAWIPVSPTSPNPAFEHALCAWWNSTPGILTLLHCRAKSLDYPRFALHSLRALLIPDPNLVDVTPLADAFTETRAKALQPWPQMHDCPNRAILDQAAAQVLRVDGRTIATGANASPANPRYRENSKGMLSFSEQRKRGIEPGRNSSWR